MPSKVKELNNYLKIESIIENSKGNFKLYPNLIFKYEMPSESYLMWKKLKDLILNEPNIKFFYATKTYVTFQPNYLFDNLFDLKQYGLITPTDDLSDNTVFLFEFNLTKDRINFNFNVGDGDQNTRKKLYNICLKHRDVFNKIVRPDSPLNDNWKVVFQKCIIAKNEIGKSVDGDTIEKLMEKRFQELIEIDLPKIIYCINEEISYDRVKNG